MRIAGRVSFGILGLLVAVSAVMMLVGLTQTSAVCSGDVVNLDACWPAQRNQAIFGGIVDAAVIVAAAIVSSALLVAARLENRATERATATHRAADLADDASDIESR